MLCAMSWFDELHQQLIDQGQVPHVIPAGAGRLLIAEHAARLLAVEVPGIDENLIFHTDATGDGQITGGDRLWLAPEVAWFWPSLKEAREDPKGTASCPSDIDPGRYVLVANETPHTLWSTAALQDMRNGNHIALNVQRHFSACAPIVDHPGLQCVSFLIRNGVSIAYTDDADERINAEPGAVAGCWDILQVPPTGTLICPTTAAVDPRSYYDPFGKYHVDVSDESVRFLIDGQHRIKMGIKPHHSTGRMGYYRELGNGYGSLILRVFAPLPGEPYCDLPRDSQAHDAIAQHADHPEQFDGDALQAYNDDGDSFPGTSFGEMEYHDPCVVAPEADQAASVPLSRTGQCVTHVLVGPPNSVKKLGAELLGVAIDPIPPLRG